MKEILGFYGFQFDLCGFVFPLIKAVALSRICAGGSGSDAPQPTPQRRRERLPDLFAAAFYLCSDPACNFLRAAHSIYYESCTWKPKTSDLMKEEKTTILLVE